MAREPEFLRSKKWFGVANEAQKEACSFWRMSAGGEADASSRSTHIALLFILWYHMVMNTQPPSFGMPNGDMHKPEELSTPTTQDEQLQRYLAFTEYMGNLSAAAYLQEQGSPTTGQSLESFEATKIFLGTIISNGIQLGEIGLTSPRDIARQQVRILLALPIESRKLYGSEVLPMLERGVELSKKRLNGDPQVAEWEREFVVLSELDPSLNVPKL